MIVYNNNYNTMIESKNYTNPVPTKEVEKFINDMKSKNYDSGIFISKSKIMKK